jgi:stress response protein YsnF
MTNTSTDAYAGWIGLVAVDPDGDKIGKIHDVYADDVSGQPEWLAVTTGFFGTRVSFVPLHGATVEGDEVCVAYEKDLVKDAPNVEADGSLTPDEEGRLYTHYGLGVGTTARGTREADATADDAMTRSEEEVAIGTRTTETGRARLRKWVETERATETVPVSHEEVRVVREPITDANRDRALRGPELTSSEHEVVLHAEEPVVEKRVVPKERVRLETETVTEEVPVETEVRKERVVTEGEDRGDVR